MVFQEDYYVVNMHTGENSKSVTASEFPQLGLVITVQLLTSFGR